MAWRVWHGRWDGRQWQRSRKRRQPYVKTFWTLASIRWASNFWCVAAGLVSVAYRVWWTLTMYRCLHTNNNYDSEGALSMTAAA
jgi:hypothetical protein